MKEIPLTRGLVALVDDEDYEWLIQWSWCARPSWNTFYACRRKQRGPENPRRVGNIDMHRVILGLQRGERCDHKDGNGLNNQRSNLRRCDYVQNNGNMALHKNNASGYKGVRFRSGKWEAQISRGDRMFYLGRFVSPKDAARAYDAAALAYFGEFARTNQQMGLI